MKLAVRLLLVAFAVMIGFKTLSAQWQPTITPKWGSVNRFAVIDSNLFMATSAGGVYRSNDDGIQWTQVNNGLDETYVYALAVSGRILFAGTFDGVFLSSDQGDHWTRSGLMGKAVYDLVVNGTAVFARSSVGWRSTDNGTTWAAIRKDSADVDVTALAVTSGAVFAGTIAGVLRSDDNGLSWTPDTTGLTNTIITALAVNGTDLFAGTSGGGVFRSADKGTHWTAINSGLTPKNITTLAASGTHLFAGTSDNGVWMSWSNGDVWAKANTPGPAARVWRLAAHGPNIFALTDNGDITSDNYGVIWNLVNTTMTKENVIALAVIDTTFYAASYRGIFRSTDKGRSWTPAAPMTTLSYGTIFSFVAYGKYLIAATSNGIFRSADKGMTWSELNAGSISTRVNVLLVSGTVLYAGTSDGVYRSTNDGTSWGALNIGMKYINVSALAVNGNDILAGTDDGAFRSRDKGVSWEKIGPANAQVFSFAVNKSFLFAGTKGGVYRSADSGTTWNASNTGVWSPRWYSFAVLDDGGMFAGTSKGVVYSRDYGASWVDVNYGMTGTDVPALVVDGTDLYAGLYNAGMWKRPLFEITTIPPPPTLHFPADAAVDVSAGPTFSWNAVNGAETYGFQLSTTSTFSTIEINWNTDNATSSVVNGLTYGKKYYWRVNAKNAAGSSAWTTGSFTTLPRSVQPQWIEVGHPGDYVFSLAAVGTYIFVGTRLSGVLCSTNDGLTWQKRNIGFSGQTTVNDLIEVGTTLIASISDNDSRAEVYISTDSGATWSNANAGLSDQGTTSLAASDSILFAGTYRGGVYVSTNFGMNWTPANNGLTNMSVTALAVSGPKLFAGTGSGVFLTTDNGAHWKSVSDGLPNVEVVALAVVGTTLFASISYGHGVYRSTDDGASWTKSNIGLTNKDVHCFAVSGAALLAGVGLNYSDGGVYLSTDNGGSWRSVSDGLKSTSVIGALAISSTTLYAADAYHGGVWRRPLAEMITAVETRSAAAPTSFKLDQNYPNPFNPSTTFSFSLPSRSCVTLEIFDVMGRKVDAIIIGDLPAGIHSRQWNAPVLPSGVYFYRLTAGSFTESKKLIILK